MGKSIDGKSSQESEVLILLNEIFSCSKCLPNESLCKIHSKLIKKILVQESQKES